MGSGAILNESIKAKEILNDCDISAEVWSATSFNLLRKDGMETERENIMNPLSKRETYLDKVFNDSKVPVVASTDYMRAYPEQIRPYVSSDYYVLGTDGFGRSDSRQKLREFFEVDAKTIVQTSVYALYKSEIITKQKLNSIYKKLGVKKISQIHGKCNLKKIVQVPDLGDANEVEVIEVCVKKGDVISADDPLIVLESEKAAMEVPSPDAGKIVDIKISLGDQVSKGDSILEIEFEEIKAGKKLNQSKSSNPNEAKSIQSIPIPDLGDAEDVEVIELCVKVGDKVNQDDSIIVLESEKAAMEVPTPVEGVIKKINVDIGDKVSEGNIF